VTGAGVESRGCNFTMRSSRMTQRHVDPIWPIGMPRRKQISDDARSGAESIEVLRTSRTSRRVFARQFLPTIITPAIVKVTISTKRTFRVLADPPVDVSLELGRAERKCIRQCITRISVDHIPSVRLSCPPARSCAAG